MTMPTFVSFSLCAKLQVTCMPDTQVVERSPQDELLVLCCDGVWDVMSNEVCEHTVLHSEDVAECFRGILLSS